MQSSLCLSLTPVSYPISAAYGVGTLEVDMCSIIFSATYVIFTFVAMPLYTKWPFTRVIRLACFVMLTGSWIRVGVFYGDQSFWPCLLGSTWLSLAYPLFLSAVSLVVQRWFPDHQKAISTTICGLSLPVGNILAFTMTGLAFQTIDRTSTREEV